MARDCCLSTGVWAYSACLVRFGWFWFAMPKRSLGIANYDPAKFSYGFQETHQSNPELLCDWTNLPSNIANFFFLLFLFWFLLLVLVVVVLVLVVVVLLLLLFLLLMVFLSSSLSNPAASKTDLLIPQNAPAPRVSAPPKAMAPESTCKSASDTAGSELKYMPRVGGRGGSP